MNNQDSHNNSDWKACTPGTLTSLSMRLKRNRQRGTIMKATMLAAAVLLTIGAGRMLFQVRHDDPRQPTMYAGISCGDVQSKLADWKKGQLDEATATRIDEHLELCSVCAAKAKALQAKRDCTTNAVMVALATEVNSNRLRRRSNFPSE